MGLADQQMSENVSNNGDERPWRAWEPDHEPSLDADACCALPALDDLRQSQSPSPPASALAPLNHHNQVTRFMAKQTLGYIPKISARSPERTSSPPSAAFGAFNFESPRGGGGSPSFRLPPLSPQKWAGPSPFADDAPSEGRASLPTLGSTFIQRSGSFSECASPIPPLKRQHQETPPHHAMSIADLCQPTQYIRALSCPSDTNPAATPAPVEPVADKSWRPAIEPFQYIRTQSCSSDTLLGSLPHSGKSSPVDDFRRNRLERSTSMDARMLNEARGLKRPAEIPDLTQWLDRSRHRDPLISLADSADSMLQLEQAGRSMHISDSPRSDVAANEAKREKKLCAFPQCASNAVTRGLCISHGGGRRCQRKGCTRGAQSKGLCVAHGGGRICRAAGCSNIQRSMGLCIRHGGGRRCSVKGCQKGVVRQDLCTAHGGKRKCRVPECTKHVKKKGLCRSHANSMYASSAGSS